MKMFLTALSICALLPLFAECSFSPVPIYYVTQKEIVSEAKQLFIFRIPMCGGEQFEHYTGNVFVNFPNLKWNPSISDFVHVQVLDIHSHVVADNKLGANNYTFEFSFLYHQQFSDLTLHVTAGNAPDLKYTITVTFTKDPQNGRHHQQPFSSPPLQQKRHYQSEFEVRTWEKMKTAMTNATTQDMVSVFKTASGQTVATADVVGLQLDYCFNPASFPGVVVVSTYTADEKSGFATYVCTHEVTCASTEEAKFSDTSGASVNFVLVKLTDKVGQLGPIRVLVRGEGRFMDTNSFTFTASKFMKEIVSSVDVGDAEEEKQREGSPVVA